MKPKKKIIDTHNPTKQYLEYRALLVLPCCIRKCTRRCKSYVSQKTFGLSYSKVEERYPVDKSLSGEKRGKFF